MSAAARLHIQPFDLDNPQALARHRPALVDPHAKRLLRLGAGVEFFYDGDGRFDNVIGFSLRTWTMTLPCLKISTMDCPLMEPMSCTWPPEVGYATVLSNTTLFHIIFNTFPSL